MRACARFALEHDQHENPLDLLDDKNYVENVFSNGKKSTGESFSTKELDAIKESMIACREKVNLPAQVRVMLGILDESNLLEEGEVLVGNGAITGDVLVLRSPCKFMNASFLVFTLQKYTFICITTWFISLSRHVPRRHTEGQGYL